MVIVAAVALAYSNAFDLPFVFDDIDNITGNPHLRQLLPLRESLGAPPQSAVAGRPLVALSLALNYALGGLAPEGFHAFNLLVHAFSALLVFATLRRVLVLPRVPPPVRSGAFEIAGATALLWAVHPLNSETVDYVIQRTESLAGLWSLVAIYAAVRAFQDASWRWPVLATLAACLGVASKETAVTVPALVLLLDVVTTSGSIRAALRSRGRLYAGLVASWVLLIALIAGGPRFRSAGFASGVSPIDYLLNQGPMIATYLKLAIWPDPLLLDYGLTTPVPAAQTLPFVAVIAVLLLVSLYLLRRRPLAGMAGLWFFITLAPASSLIPIATEVGAERRMYLVLIAVIGLAAGCAWCGLLRRAPAARRAPVWGTAVVLLACALGVRTWTRNTDYRDLVGLWTQVVEARPHARAHYNLGIALKARGQLTEALAHYRAASAMPEAHYALGFEHAAAGDYAAAVDEFRRFLALRPDDMRAPEGQALLGRSLLALGRWPEALTAFGAALSMTPNNADAVRGKGDALAGLERWSEAADAYQRYVALAPGDADGYSSLGRAFVALDQGPRALQAFERAVQLSPDSLSHGLNYGYALISSGQVEQAARLYEGLLPRHAQSAALLSALGVVRAAQGRRGEAREFFDRSLAIEPGNPQTQVDLEMALGPPSERPGTR